MTTIETDPLVTRDGVRLHVRRAREEDEPALAAFFARVTPDDLRFRFLSPVREVRRDWLVAMTSPDDAKDSLIAFDDKGDVIATAMLAGDSAGARAEAAIAIRGDRKGQGVGWTLLDHLVGHARRRGYTSIESIEDRANSGAIKLEREMGFEAVPVEGDPMLVCVRKTLR
ncbi:GNAT family N-acetyltransferase [Sphingomonas sp. MMS12-HWE2-04]|uniref:GNAT family N-acetyltransferase n=1 Tax=Sphingomonas sp. MMS12-HWE2-04 TaxID=3234199 RepID=UPI00384C880A